MMKRIITTILLLLPMIGLAQHESTLHFMQSISQSRYNNPAMTPRYKATVGLPGLSSIYFQYGNSGFAYKHLISQQEEGDSLQFTLNEFYNKLGARNYVNFNFNVDLFHLAFKVNPRVHFMFNITPKSYNRVMYPRDIVGLVVEGNQLGETMTLSPEAESIQYLEYGVGGSYKIDRFWTVGARFKYLKGIANVSSENTRIDLTTTQDYHINVVGEGLFRTSGISQFINNEIDIQGYSDVMALMGNTGFALDLGATFKPMDKLTVGLSLVDIGSIRWTKNLTNYVMDSDSANFTFRGFNIGNLLNGQSEGFSETIDSLSNNIEPYEVDGEAYSTFLPGRMYLSGSYLLARNITANLLLMGELYNGRFNSGISANIHKEFGRRMSMSVSYTANNRSFNNLGMGLSFNLQPIQLYFVSDNLLSAPFALLTSGEVNPYLRSTQNLNLRFGLNLVFGWDKEEEGISTPPNF